MLPAQAAIPAAEPAREQTPAAEQAEAPVDSDALIARADPCERIAIPAEVGGQPPSTVATLAADAGGPPRDANPG